MTSLVSIWSTPPEMVVVAKENELRPATAGMLSGALAGPAMLATASLLANLTGDPHITHTIGSALSRGATTGTASVVLAYCAMAIVGGAVGALFAWLTRRLRVLAPLIAFAIILATATWVVLQTLALPRVAPWLARALPFGPMVIGAMVFGVVAALELPLRTLRGSPARVSYS